MSKEETLAAIAALPVSDEVKAHACRLIKELPEWCPEPEAVTSEHESLIVRWSVRDRILKLTVDDTCEQLDAWISFTQLSPTSADIASTMFHYGMVADAAPLTEERRAELEWRRQHVRIGVEMWEPGSEHHEHCKRWLAEIDAGLEGDDETRRTTFASMGSEDTL